MRGPWSPMIVFGLIALGSATKCPTQKTSPGREILCYTSVVNVQLLTDSVCRCTSLVHQGHDVRNVSSSGLEVFRKSLKEIYPALQVVVSIHDPTGTLRTSSTTRQAATARLVNILKEFDGIELNVTAGSKERLVHFVKGLRDEMVRKSYDKRIFLVLPTRSEELAKKFAVKELSRYVDLFTLPTHYLVDADEAYYTFHPSRMMGLFDMLNTDSLVDLASGLGAPKRKILISVPAGAYRFSLANEDENAPRSPTVEKDPVVIGRKELCDSMSHGEWTVERDEDLTAPYAFQNKTWLAFEDKISIGIKGKYVLLRDLAGLAIHDLEYDSDTECGKPLTHDVHRSFTDFKRKPRQAVLSSLEDDLHQSEISYQDHVKSSDFRVIRVVDTEGHIRAVRENTQTEFSCPRQGYFVHPRSCNRFYRCVKFNQGIENYSVFEFDCPAGLSFDERTEVCVWPHTLPQGSPCPGSSEIAPVARARFECPNQTGYYVDRQNCRWFFACIDLGGARLMAYEFRCPYGLVFDQDKLVCEWPWLVPGCSDSDSGYARTEYSGEGYGGASTSRVFGGYETGGYYTGSLGFAGDEVHASSGAGYGTTGVVSSGGGHSTSGYKSTGRTTGRGHSGPAGVTVSGQTGGSRGASLASGYSGSTGVATGTRYSGSTSRFAGIADGNRGSTIGLEYTGSSGVTVGGTSRSGFSAGSVGATHAGTSRSASSASHESAIGTGYSTYASSAEVHAGATGSEYSGTTADIYTGSIGAAFGRKTTNGRGHSGSTGSWIGHSEYGPSTAPVGYIESVGSTGSTGTTDGYSEQPKSTGAGYSAPNSLSLGTDSGSRLVSGQTRSSGYAGGSTATSYYAQGISGVPIYSTSGDTGIAKGASVAPSESSAADRFGFTIPVIIREDDDSSIYAPDGPANAALGEHTGHLSGSIGIGPAITSTSSAFGSTASGPGYGIVPITSKGEAPSYVATSSASGNVATLTGGKTASSLGFGHVIDHGTTGDIFLSTRPGATMTRNNGSPSGYVNNDLGPSIGNGDTTPRMSTRYSSDGLGDRFVESGAGRSDSSVTRATGGARSDGGATYHPGRGASRDYGFTGATTGTIATGNIIEGSVITDSSLSGTLYAHGDRSGSVSTGTVDQGSVLVGVSQPGYVKTDAGTPGYVVSGGVKTVYPGSVGPGEFVRGTATSGVALTGASVAVTSVTGSASPGITVVGQTSTGISLGGSTKPGTVVGRPTASTYFADTASTAYPGSVGFAQAGSVRYSGPTKSGGRVPTTYNASAQRSGYKTTEYYDNGGRGTIKFNNGDVTSKYTENDISDYRPSVDASLPDIIATGATLYEGEGEGEGGTGSGTTLAGTGTPRPSVGEAAGSSVYSPAGSFAPSGFTKTGPTKTGITTATLGGRGSYVVGTGQRSAFNPENIGEKAFEGNVAGQTPSTKLTTEISDFDTSKITLGPSMSSGYAYGKPSAPFATGSAIGSSPAPAARTQIVDVSTTTPSPYLNVEVYNARTVTAGSVAAGHSRVTSGFTDGKVTTPSTTPVRYTTVFDAARTIPLSVSTVRPAAVVTGYNTVASPPLAPVTVTVTDHRSTFKDGTLARASNGASSRIAAAFGPTVTPPSTVTYLPPTETLPPQYGSSTTTAPAFGATYGKPFPASGLGYGSTPPPTVASTTTKGHTFAESSAGTSDSSGQGYSTLGSIITAGGSPTNLDVPRDEVEKLITNYHRGSTKYSHSVYSSYTGSDRVTTGALASGYSKQTSSFSPSSSFSESIARGSTVSSTRGTERTPPVTTYSGGYGKSTPSTTPSYAVGTKPPPGQGRDKGNSKVIVKWSDLRPLLLGKLGAECTCKADPFDTLRGPGAKRIASSNGNVDLANYDESDVYVDLENEASSEYGGDYATSYESPSPSPYKIGNQNRDDETPLTAVSANGRTSSSARAPRPSGTAITPSSAGRFLATGTRAGKKLNAGGTSRAGYRSNGRPDGESDGESDADEVLQGVSDCARPGLFRHPNFCNRFYACHWDEWKKKFTLHTFKCPVHLTFDTNVAACNWPSKGPACQDDNLLV